MIKFECVTELSELQCLFPGEPFCDNVRYAAYKTEYGGNDFSLLFSLNGNICILERIKSDKNEPSVTDGLLRSALDFAFRRGVDTAVCSLFEFSDELISLGFTQKDGVFFSGTQGGRGGKGGVCQSLRSKGDRRAGVSEYLLAVPIFATPLNQILACVCFCLFCR